MSPVSKLLLIICIVFGIFFRVYNLGWGAPFFFHPDERNIASAVVQLRFPEQLNPNFFAYGSIPMYVVFITGLVYNFFTPCNFSLKHCTVLFEQAIILGRVYSALFSILVIPLLYFIGKKTANVRTGILAALLGTLSVGLVQYAHFATFEMWLTFFSLVLFFFCLTLLEKTKVLTCITIGILLGILIGTKVSSIVLLILPLLALVLNKHPKNRNYLFHAILSYFLIILVGTIVFAITNPFSLFNFQSFQSTFQYESSVALGTLPVFYTGEFYGKIPILFQLVNIYPFIINPILTFLFILSFMYIVFLSIRTRNRSFFLLIAFYVLLFISQAVLFTKWTRYIIPTLPFMYLIIAVSLDQFFERKKYVYYYSVLVLIIISILFSFSYVKTAFIDPDTRVGASLWAQKNIPADAKIISEVYDMGIVPFNPHFKTISLFDFYNLDPDTTGENATKLKDQLKTTGYIILPSQRLVQTRIYNEKQFPNGNIFYKKLFNGTLGFSKIYETPCDMFCKITYGSDPIFSFEQTTSVFDRPTILIFKKNEL